MIVAWSGYIVFSHVVLRVRLGDFWLQVDAACVGRRKRRSGTLEVDTYQANRISAVERGWGGLIDVKGGGGEVR